MLGATVTQKWTDYVTRWVSAPVFLANVTQNFGTVASVPVNIAGKVFQVGSIYRFVPTATPYLPNYDTFWTTYSNTATPPLSGRLASRATL